MRLAVKNFYMTDSRSTMLHRVA